MAVSFELDEADHVFRMTFNGELTDDVMLDARARFLKLKQAMPAYTNIVDLSAVTRYEVSSRLIGALAGIPPAQLHEPIVVVAPSDVAYGASRMFQIMSEQVRQGLHVVRTMEEACELLGVKSPKFLPISSP